MIAMQKQVAFTEHEAALLLDAYLRTLSGDKSRKESIRDCSAQLRQIALNAGTKIDETYRNVNGITFQMASMESAYQGHTIMKPATRLFTEMVSIYRNDTERFHQLLKEAENMASTELDNEAMFNAWLAANVSETQLAELHLAYQEIESQARIAKIIKKSLYDNIDPTTIKRIRANIESSKIFKFTHKHQWGRIMSAMNILLQFANQNNQEVTIISSQNSEMHETIHEEESTHVLKRNDNPLNEEDSQSAEGRESFYRWLHDIQKMAEATCRSYTSAIHSAEKFAEDHNLTSCKLYSSDKEMTKSTAEELFSNEEFVQWNNDSHNRFRAAITKLLAFYCIDWSLDRKHLKKTSDTSSTTNEEPYLDLTPLVTILTEYFPKGYRLESTLDKKRLCRYYEELTGKTLELDQAQVEATIKNYGIIYDGKIYMPQNMLSEEMRDQIFAFIERCFEEGKAAVYFEAIFKEFSEELLDHNIYNAEMLKAYLAHYVSDRYHMSRSYLSFEVCAEIDPIDEVRQCLKQCNTPIQIDELCSMLSHITDDRVRYILSSNGEFVRNSKGEYFHADSLDLTEEELENIAQIIESAIEEHKFLSGNELYEAIQKKYPYTFEKNDMLSMIGWRDALKYKYGERFSFVGNIISKAGSSLSMSDVFAEYAKGRQRFSVDELDQFADSIGTPIYFDSLYENAIRISHQWFVKKEGIMFSVKEIDAVLNRYCNGNYMPISAVTEFATLPDASFPWTEYLLEQYVAFFSEEFYLLHGNFNKNYAVGAIVRKAFPCNSFDDLVTDILVNNDIPLNKREVLDYLAENGFIARRSYTNIEALMINARAMRNQKEK